MLDLVLPQRCALCAVPGTQVCRACSDALPRLRGPLCERCGAPTAWPVRRCAECAARRLAFSQARAAVAYEGSVRKLVTSWKEHGLRRLAAWAAAVVAETLPRPDASCLVFVPGDAERQLLRGHHAAERLACELGEAWELPVERLLERGPRSHRQRGLSRGARRRNVVGAFQTRARSPTKVTLVDDVYTTGATAHAAAAALRSAGAREVQVVAFARAIRIR